MNNVDYERKRDCTSCFSCFAVCKVGAITIEQDENGFYKPVIDIVRCVNCGMCRKVCYSHINLEVKDIELKSYYGWHKDTSILNSSASGGITSALARVALEDGYIVIGCSYNHNEKKAKHIIVKKQKDIEKIRGSKYFQSDLSDLYLEIRMLPKDTKIVFFGTPCQVLGFKNYLKIAKFDMKNVMLIELFCHGISSPLVWKSYIQQSRIKDAEDVKFRTKAYGWHYPSNEFVKMGKNIPTKKAGDDFFTAYYSLEYFNKSCYTCQIKKIFGNSDLRIGDFWGERFSHNRQGVSCILTFSNKGEHLLKKSEPYFFLHEVRTEEILNAQSYNTDHKFNEKEWNKNFYWIRQYGLKYSLSNMNKRKPLLQRIKRSVYIRISNAICMLKMKNRHLE